jgi:hypothetical protein
LPGVGGVGTATFPSSTMPVMYGGVAVPVCSEESLVLLEAAVAGVEGPG